MLVVADSSALVSLAVCDGLQWLDIRFREVRVPEAVFEECTVTGKPQAGVLRQYLQGKTLPISLSETVITPSGLGNGELEAMSLYKHLHADFLLIDDRRARKVAIFNKLNTIGSIGMLIWAKDGGHIAAIAPKLVAIQQAGIFLSESVLQEALQLVGE
jgi:predicted nucleic acid-binding protein